MTLTKKDFILVPYIDIDPATGVPAVRKYQFQKLALKGHVALDDYTQIEAHRIRSAAQIYMRGHPGITISVMVTPVGVQVWRTT